MRRRQTAALTLWCALAVPLAACTSEEPTQDVATTTAAGMEGAVPTSGWWCGLIQEDTVAVATGDRAAEAREVVRVNDGSTYHCDVLLPTGEGDETEVAMSLVVTADDEEGARTAREEVTGMEGVRPGPEYLGESYLAPGVALGIMPCGAPIGSDKAGTQVTWTYQLRALLPEGRELTEELAAPLGRQVRLADQSVGCSPSEAQRPADDAATTTAP